MKIFSISKLKTKIIQSTLDCIEIEQEDYSLMNNIEKGSNNRINLKSNTVVQYGSVPEEIKK